MDSHSPGGIQVEHAPSMLYDQPQDTGHWRTVVRRRSRTNSHDRRATVTAKEAGSSDVNGEMKPTQRQTTLANGETTTSRMSASTPKTKSTTLHQSMDHNGSGQDVLSPTNDGTTDDGDVFTEFKALRKPLITKPDGPSASALNPSGRSEPAVTSPLASSTTADNIKVRKLSPTQIKELTSSPESLKLHFIPSPSEKSLHLGSNRNDPLSDVQTTQNLAIDHVPRGSSVGISPAVNSGTEQQVPPVLSPSSKSKLNGRLVGAERPLLSARTRSTPAPINGVSAKSSGSVHHLGSVAKARRSIPKPLQLDSSDMAGVATNSRLRELISDPMPSPMPSSIPLPPLSIPTYLQLELSSSRPSPLYIHRSVSSEFPYESSRVKFERLLNFLMLPPQLEGILWFGALACLDAWLYSFTILPLRFIKALAILVQWWGTTLMKETREIASFIYWGSGRMMQRRRRGTETGSYPSASIQPRNISGPARSSVSVNITQTPKTPALNGSDQATPTRSQVTNERRNQRSTFRKHRRTQSIPSALLPSHKADLLKGFVMLFSCLILTRFDASRMYHGIRGQAAIKLYVIYNVLEVCDRLFSALGQDVFECLFSRETLERTPDGRSKILRPFGMFLLALSYNVIHSTALFYQVITLNVAVNSYSNALLTLLMSNQFVEIKSTVFKKFEKENLFQLTCADVVERFQLWLMLLIIALRNIVEVGGLTLGASPLGDAHSLTGTGSKMGTSSGASIIPKSFTIFPKWTGQVLGPFLLVLGSEMLVDWLKHAYITKFNNTKPAIYGRFLDILAKDYYSNAFADQNLTRRLGLPVIPLSCLFIRATLQTYHMFLATNITPRTAPSPVQALSNTNATHHPTTTAALQHFDNIIRHALGRSSFGAGSSSSSSSWWWSYDLDDLISLLFTSLFFLFVFIVLLALKLSLGILLLRFARRRYKTMKERELQPIHTTPTPPNPDGTGGGHHRRVGGWGVVEVDDDKRRWIYQDDPDGARQARERERAVREKMERASETANFGGVSRYTMIAKRIW